MSHRSWSWLRDFKTQRRCCHSRRSCSPRSHYKVKKTYINISILLCLPWPLLPLGLMAVAWFHIWLGWSGPVCHSSSLRGGEGLTRRRWPCSSSSSSSLTPDCPIPAQPHSWPSSPDHSEEWWLLLTGERPPGACYTQYNTKSLH